MGKNRSRVSANKRQQNQRPKNKSDNNMTEDHSAPHVNINNKETEPQPKNINVSNYHAPASENSIPIWEKPADISDQWKFLEGKTHLDLSIGCLNVCKMGHVKRKELGRTLNKLDTDIFSVTEHHKSRGEFNDDDAYSTIKDFKTLKIKGFSSASKHRKAGSGGVAWYLKKTIGAEIWEGADLPENLREAGLERCWIKIPTKTGPLFLAVVYMPVETSDDQHEEKFKNILDVLNKDCSELDADNIPYLLYGDFNSHLGSDSDDPMGIPGNHEGIGNNGQKLLDWVRLRNLAIVNSLSGKCHGLWTRMKGRSKSVLDLLLVSKGYLSKVSWLNIDDSREMAVKSDHNLLMSLIRADFHRIQWSPPDRRRWDIPKIKKGVYKRVLAEKLEAAKERRQAENTDLSENIIDKDIREAIEEALGASTKLISMSPKKPKMDPRIDALNKEISAKEKTRSSLLKKNPQKTSASWKLGSSAEPARCARGGNKLPEK